VKFARNNAAVPGDVGRQDARARVPWSAAERSVFWTAEKCGIIEEGQRKGTTHGSHEAEDR
jgi:hypothetical protein